MMAKSRLEKIQGLHQATNLEETEILQELRQNVCAGINKKGYRADLRIASASRNTTGTFAAEVKFNASLGHPSEKDLLTIVAQTYPTHQIDWVTAEVDTDAGVVVLQLDPMVYSVPVSSVKAIPAEFKAIGSGIYKRAADASGNVQEIWSLSKQEDGSLALTRGQDDIEVVAEAEESFKAGDVVNTPQGPGRLIRFDDLGNAMVQVGSKKHLVAASEVQPYSIDKERQKLIDYYTQMYGDAAFAKDLVKDYDTQGGKTASSQGKKKVADEDDLIDREHKQIMLRVIQILSTSTDEAVNENVKRFQKIFSRDGDSYLDNQTFSNAKVFLKRIWVYLSNPKQNAELGTELVETMMR